MKQLLILISFSFTVVGCGADNSAEQPHDTPIAANTAPVAPDARIEKCATLKTEFETNPPYIDFQHTLSQNAFGGATITEMIEIHNGVASKISPFGGFATPVVSQTYDFKFCKVNVDENGNTTFKEGE